MLFLLFLFSYISLVLAQTTPAPFTSSNFFISSSTASLPDCDQNGLKYVYTPCDELGRRWKVQIPKSNTCKLTVPESPVAGLNCSFSCNAGEYLDIAKQNCQKCFPGTYSAGDSKRFAKWDTIPEDFESSGHGESSDGSKSEKCAEAIWKPKGEYLQSNGSFCRSTLRYIVDLAKQGNISFTVKADDESVFFHVWVEGTSTCSSSYETTSVDNDKTFEMYYTLSSDWKTQTLDLNKGRNVVYFVAAYFSSADFETNDKTKSFSNTAVKSVLIKEIVVRGFPFSQKCEPCEPGTFSSAGASSCTQCPIDTFSVGGVGACTLCQFDEFAPIGSATCQKRKSCTENDYHEIWEPCRNKKVTKKYEWNQPHICKPDGTVVLKSPVEDLPCPSCNPGMTFNGSACNYCPTGYKSDNFKCMKCPPKFKSVPGLFYHVWTDYPPPPMHMYCLAKPSTGCLTKRGWNIQSNFITSGIGHSDDAELVLYITIPEFVSIDSEFLLDFEIEGCSNGCRLKIEMIDAGSSVNVLKVYEGDTERTEYKYKRHSKAGTRFRLIFEKLFDDSTQTYKNTRARVNIYKIEITKTSIGGAKDCVQCEASASDSESCINCPEGQYIDGNSCTPCPENTYLKDDINNIGIDSCLKCPEGTISDPGSAICHSDCIVRLKDKTYNFTAFAGFHLVYGAKTFTTKGYQYYHMYNVSFCGHPYTPSVCQNSAPDSEKTAIAGAVCRSTIIPDAEVTMKAQSISVGDVIEKISDLTKKKEDNSTEETEISRRKVQLLVSFSSSRRTTVCVNGTGTTIEFVCDSRKEGKGELLIGNTYCNAETCDGCIFVFTWKSRYACPKCTENDYRSITSGCVKSKKTQHYFWKEPHICIDGVRKPEDTEFECTIFEKSILDFKVVIMAFLLCGVVLAAGVIFLCYRNRSLSYKYHRLIDASQTKDGELPAAEVCVSDGEEDEEQVVLARSRGKKRILDRIKKLGKNKKEDFSEFETIDLDKMKDFSDDDDEI